MLLPNEIKTSKYFIFGPFSLLWNVLFYSHFIFYVERWVQNHKNKKINCSRKNNEKEEKSFMFDDEKLLKQFIHKISWQTNRSIFCIIQNQKKKVWENEMKIIMGINEIYMFWNITIMSAYS